MKSVTIRKAQHELPRLLRDVEAGKAIEIRRRKEPIARLIPLNQPEKNASWSKHRRRLSALWGSATIDLIDETLSDLRSED